MEPQTQSLLFLYKSKKQRTCFYVNEFFVDLDESCVIRRNGVPLRHFKLKRLRIDIPFPIEDSK